MSTTFIVNVEVAIVRNSHYLAVTRSSAEEYGAGWVCFPGGKLDHHSPDPDILEATAHREVLEEVGIHLIEPLVYVESHTFVVGDQSVLDVVMLARATHETPYPAAEDEVESVKWLSYCAFKAHPAVQPWTCESLDRVETTRLELGW